MATLGGRIRDTGLERHRGKNWRASDGSPLLGKYDIFPGARSGCTGYESQVIAREVIRAAKYVGQEGEWCLRFGPTLRVVRDWSYGGPPATQEQHQHAERLWLELILKVKAYSRQMSIEFGPGSGREWDDTFQY
jgi:hypothetical protein